MDVRDHIGSILCEQPLGVLATVRDGAPHTCLVAFAATENLASIVFLTMRSTRKYEHIRANERVALLIDDRTNEVEDFESCAVITAKGRCREVDTVDREAIGRVYFGRHPHLRSYGEAPSCALMRIDVDVYELVTHFQNVVFLEVSR